MKSGDVWWYEQSHERPRPVCILTRDRAIAVLQRLVVVPATSVIRELETEVVLDVEDGMPRRCALGFDSIWTVRKALLTDRITTLSPARMHEVCEALRIATGC